MATIPQRFWSRLAPLLVLAGGAAALGVATARAPGADAPAAPRAEPPAAERPRAARSVHLHYPAPDGALYYNEVTVEQSQRGTYFCACGFNHGYFGMQELGDGKKVVLFSVWDPAERGGEKQDPNAVEADRRAQVLAHGEGTRVRRFGGEGTGAQCFLDFDWEPGRPCRFLVRATPEGDKTTYSAWFQGQPAEKSGEKPGEKSEPTWHHMATYRTATKGEPLRGYYSFIEDFRRDGKSATEPRSARFGNGWVKSTGGDWVRLTRARFTGDSTPLDNVDASASDKDGSFRLATGGDTRNTHPLNSLLQHDPPGLSLPEFHEHAEHQEHPEHSARPSGAQKSP
jgi:hypothetical protein